MAYYSDTYLANIKKCLEKAISTNAVTSAVRSLYLIEKCHDCNTPQDCCDYHSWWTTVNAWNNTAVENNVITEEDFKKVIADINVALNCSQSVSPLTIITHPASVNIGFAQTANFSVTAAGGVLPHTYQWQYNGVDIVGATSSTYSIVGALPANNGIYRAVVRDFANNTVTSNQATLIVATSSLQIITHPISQTVAEGDIVNFIVVASGGSLPYSYQWRKDGVNISGATSNSLSLGTAAANEAGVYSVVVTDAASSTAISSNATLVVNTASMITISFGYSAGNPYVDNSTAPAMSNEATESIIHNANVGHIYPPAAPDTYIVMKEPVAEIQKTAFNNGSNPFVGNVIPPAGSDEFRAPFAVAGFRYYVSRSPLAFDYNQPINFVTS